MGEFCGRTRLNSVRWMKSPREIGLDVFEKEPQPADHAFWHMPNVIVTPHPTGRDCYECEHPYGLVVDELRRYRNREL